MNIEVKTILIQGCTASGKTTKAYELYNQYKATGDTAVVLQDDHGISELYKPEATFNFVVIKTQVARGKLSVSETVREVPKANWWKRKS